MMSLPAALRDPPLRTALSVLAICFLFQLMGRGVMEAYAVFLLPLSTHFGWDRTSVSGVYSVAYIVLGFSGPLVGWLYDRWGPARLYLLGIACAVAGLLICANATALWHFYVGMGALYGFAGACVGAVTLASLLSRWFGPSLNTALAVAYASGGIGIMLFAPVAQHLLDGYGWRNAYLVLAAMMALLLPCVAALTLLRARQGSPRLQAPRRRVSSRDGEHTPDDGLTLRAAVRGAAFWGLCWSFLFTGIGMYTVLLQTPAYLVELGYTPQFAASAFGAIGLLAPIGMVGFGWLGDRIGRRRSVLLSYGCTIIGMLCVLAQSWQPSLWLIIGFVGCFGISFGSRGPAISAIAAALFRGPQMGRIYGFITIGQGVGGGLGAWAGGFWRDLSGSYEVGIATGVLMILFGAAPFAALRTMSGAEPIARLPSSPGSDSLPR